MLAFSGRRDAGTIGTGPAGHWHCRRWSLRSWGARDRFDQPTDDIVPRRRIGKSACAIWRRKEYRAALEQANPVTLQPANGAVADAEGSGDIG
jgi:hypothetical protein